MMLIDTVSVLSLQLKKLRRHNESAIDLSNANPARGHKEVRKVNGSHHGDNPLLEPQESKSRQNLCQVQPPNAT